MLLASQFLSFKDYAERLNQALKELDSIFRKSTLSEAIEQMNHALPEIFNSERANIWVVDQSTGSLYTYFERLQRVGPP